jgi:site-specific DNA-cytosine methylase
MNVLELFAGSRSVGKVAERMGHRVFSTDIEPFAGINHVCDILKFDPQIVPFIPDFVWASPTCTTWSVASCSTHWTVDKQPKTEAAKHGVLLVEKTLEIIDHFLKLNPKLIWAFENPRGLLRKHPVVAGLPRTTIWYCTYGDTRAKPTDIWTNNLRSIFNPLGWQPRPECWNGNWACQHESAPRGSQTGTQGLKGAYDRSKIPLELVREILWFSQRKVVAV